MNVLRSHSAGHTILTTRAGTRQQDVRVHVGVHFPEKMDYASLNNKVHFLQRFVPEEPWFRDPEIKCSPT